MELNAIIAAVIGLLIFLIVIYYFFWWPPPFTRARHSLGEARVLERGGMRFQYFVGGSANGPTVILIPSAGREASDFNELVSELHRDGMRTISINPPGIGLSDIPSRSVNLYDLAEFIFRVVFKETLSEGEVFVIGHAFGNRVARAFAHLYPGKTRALILISPGSADHSRPMVKRMLHLIYTLRSPSRLRSRRIRTLFFAPGNPSP